jgi:predicted Zn-dependent peptidase
MIKYKTNIISRSKRFLGPRFSTERQGIRHPSKITVFISVCLMLIAPLCAAQENSQSKEYELENGLRVFLYEKHTLPLINCSVAVNVGTKDESEETSGLVHILEHYILFRGTQFRSGTQVSQDIRSHGAYFNAYTGHDLSVFEISLPSEHADFALKNQKEILFNLKINQEQLDEEKKVILEEISQVQDDPVRYASSLVYQNLFVGHPYQKPVYGKREVIKNATVEQLEEFYHNFFVIQNCTLAIVGDFKIEEMEEKVKDTFGEITKGVVATRKYEKVRFLEKNVDINREMDVNQAYMVIGMVGPDFNHPSQYGMDILKEILSGGVNPMLNSRLRGRRNLIHRTWMSHGTLKYGGMIFIYVTLDPKNVSAVRREAINFLKDTRTMNFSMDDILGEARINALDYLESAKNLIKFKYHRSQEIGLTIATSLAQYMHQNEIPERGSYLDNLEKINSSDLRKVAANYLSQGRYVIVTILPKKKK